MAKDRAYQKAKHKIAEALRTGATELDLSRDWGATNSDRLTELPESFGQLTQLQTLDLSGNQLTALPESFTQLTQLQTLNLSRNQLIILPGSLGRITQLRTLDLSDNRLTEVPELLGRLTQLRTLNLSDNQLTKIPELLGRLTQLRTLDLSDNQLTTLPQSLSQLKQLQKLYLSRNHFGTLPELLSQLVHLRDLEVSSNQLTIIPDWIGAIQLLQQLAVSDNKLKGLPTTIGSLSSLKHLFATDNQISELPTEIGNLTNLTRLNLGGDDASFTWTWALPTGHGNAITHLPPSIAKLELLTSLNLDENPLNPELAAAYEKGIDAVKAYLRERSKGTRRRYEAKLLILGDGNEGKTCVSRALRGLQFKKQNTTRGVDVVPWAFSHPDRPKDRTSKIKLNLWDFEGQEINHQTHQFFLSTDSLYLLVFKCRDQFLLDRAEYWLDTIRSRAPGAQVAIVITECEQRMPFVPQDRLQAEYSDLLRGDHWLFAVGCADNTGIPELRQEIQRRAIDLKFMGRDWPMTYDRAETRIEMKAKTSSHISRGELYQIFQESWIDDGGYDEAARSLARLGIITEFPDCPDLNDFVVLQPQWLTKAISHVMEDKPLSDAKGEITFTRMGEIWAKQKQESMFPIFHNCMKEFELCYDMEDYDDRCMVPLRFGYLKPDIPWIEDKQFKTRRVTYKLNLRPPMGLMSRFIVKTHHMIVRPTTDAAMSDEPRGVYWHNGVFLQSGEGSLLSQALCEFDSELRTLGIEVRAAFPQKMLDQIDAYVRAVFAFFQGLKPVRSYGCIRFNEDVQIETQCPRFHEEEDILFALQCREQVRCAKGRHHVEPMRLVMGIGSFASDIRAIIREEHERTRGSIHDEGKRTRERIDDTPEWAEPLIRNIVTLLDWADRHQDTLQQLWADQAILAPEIRQEFESKLREYLGHMSDMLDERHQKSAPSLFSIGTQDRSRWNPKTYFKQTYVLTPWCECEGEMHRHDPGRVLFPTNRQWWNKTTPWIARGTKVLATGLQLAFAGMPLALGDDIYGVIRNDVIFMQELTKHLQLTTDRDSGNARKLLSASDPSSGEYLEDARGKESETSLMRAALTRFLEKLAPDQYRASQWGELKRVRLPDNTYRWLCKEHAQEARR